MSVCALATVALAASAADPPTHRPSEAKPHEPPADKQQELQHRLHSPRATVRTFLTAINAADEQSALLDEAVECLDLSDPSAEHHDGGRLAFELERVLRAIRFPTPLISNADDGPEVTLGEKPNLYVTSAACPTAVGGSPAMMLQKLPEMRLWLHRQVLETPPPKAASDVPSAYQTPQAMFRTFLDATHKGRYDAAAHCLDLSSVPCRPDTCWAASWRSS